MNTYILDTDTATVTDNELVNIHAQLDNIDNEHDLYFLWAEAESTIESYSEFWTAWEVEEVLERFIIHPETSGGIRASVFELMMTGKYLVANLASALIYKMDELFITHLLAAVSSYSGKVDAGMLLGSLGLADCPLGDALMVSRDWALGRKVGVAFVREAMRADLTPYEALRIARWAEVN